MPEIIRPKPLYPQEPTPVICFMSGSGTNVRKILEYERMQEERFGFCHYNVVAIFSDKPETSKAKQISADFGIGFWHHEDIDDFYRELGYASKNDPKIPKEKRVELRAQYDEKTRSMLVEMIEDSIWQGRKPIVALGGYMSFLTDPIIGNYLTVNVHPANLTATDKEGKRKYTGDHAVLDAILAGERFIYSSTHIAREQVDYGEVLMISAPLEVKPRHKPAYLRKHPEELEKIAGSNQDRLKEVGDWVIFPKTLEMTARGDFIMKDGRVFHRNEQGMLVPGPVMLF